MNLCGHATLASAFVLFNELDYPDEEIIFYSKSGELRVSKDKDLLMLDFPVQKPEPCPLPEVLLEAIGVEPLACLRNIDFVLVYEREQTIGRIAPRHELIRESGARGVIVTAPGTEHDFVARFLPQEPALMKIRLPVRLIRNWCLTGLNEQGSVISVPGKCQNVAESCNWSSGETGS